MPRTLRRHVSSVVSAFFKLSLSEERNGVMQPVGVCWTHPLYVAIVHPSAVLFSMLKDIELQYNLPNFHLFFFCDIYHHLTYYEIYWFIMFIVFSPIRM